MVNPTQDANERYSRRRDPRLDRQEAKRDGAGMMTAIEVDDRELATLLAALRCYQRLGLPNDDDTMKDIATDGGRLEPLTDMAIDQLCERLNFGTGSAVKPAGQGLAIAPPHKENSSEPLFRVVYAIDVNASDVHGAAELADLMMTDPAAIPPVLQVINHSGAVTTIDLSAKESPDKKGDGP